MKIPGLIHFYYVVISLLITPHGFSQQNILLNQSAYNLFVLNPAAIGLNSEAAANCHYKKNWLGIAESPELLQLTIDGATHKNKSGLGLNIVNEKAGIFSKTYLSGAFRYKVKLNKDHSLLFGLSAGFQRQFSDFSKIKADAPEEFSQWPLQQAATIPDAAFGFLYTYKKLLIGVAASQLLQQNYAYKEPVFNKTLQYKTVSQFVITLQNTFTLKRETWFYTPLLILRTPQGLPVQFDIVNSFNYKNKLLFGLGYRHYYASYANIGYQVLEKLRVIYSYEYSLGIQNYTRGGHEIGLTFGISSRSAKIKAAPDLSQDKLDELLERLDRHDQQIETLSKKTDSLDKNLSALKSEIELLKSRQISEEELNEVLKNYSEKKANNIADTSVSKSHEQQSKNSYVAKYKVIRGQLKNKPTAGQTFEVSDSTGGGDLEGLERPGEPENANYKIVLGVYQNANYARDYQKFIRRELNLDSRLIQLSDHPKNYIYVCTDEEFTSLKETLTALKTLRKNINSKSIKITKGDAWILQTLNQ